MERERPLNRGRPQPLGRGTNIDAMYPADVTREELSRLATQESRALMPPGSPGIREQVRSIEERGRTVIDPTMGDEGLGVADEAEEETQLVPDPERPGQKIRIPVRTKPKPGAKVVTNGSGPIRSIKDVQPVVKRERRVEAPLEVAQAEDEDAKTPATQERVLVGKPRLILKEIDRKGNYVRVQLMSGFVFYPFKDLQMRKFSILDHRRVIAAQVANDFSAFVDAVGGSFAEGYDIRDLTVPDFFYVLYWHRLHSYPTTPFIVTWTSKYGNLNRYNVTDMNLKVSPPKMTEEQYAVWQAKGYIVPTVRDMELFESEDLQGEDRWIWDRAQFFSGNKAPGEFVDVQDKIDHMNEACSNDLGALGLIDKFAAECDHGLVERVEVTDEAFDPRAWAETLKEQAKYLRQEAETVQQSLPPLYIARIQEADAADAQADAILATLEEGGEVPPDVETINLSIRPLDFFPNI